ncbi:hypothetical protein SAMN05421856_104417 [Chryseobacterium taichungense]|uniref:Phospholipase_D-nuclease N-terminal n=1 Tax=Chryseobacterium taichungense TaxID=295069 RepID=A0A1H7ZS66_9FLAO|nr:hypothetical protein SAMN05421856_104417 [Chryseobacterium taichungense]
MNVLSITPFQIIFLLMAIVVLYVSAIAILFKNKSGLLPYLILLVFPVIGPLGIVMGNYTKKIK